MKYKSFDLNKSRTGFTLIETLVAISLLTIAIVAPMSLTSQSLGSAYYARDQITAFYLAQEAIEAVRSIRDGRILQIAQSTNGASIDIFGNIPISDSSGNRPFTIDARLSDPSTAIATCGGTCVPLQTDGTLFGYATTPPTNPPVAGSGWTNTLFTRTVRACFVQSDASCSSATTNEMRVTVIVTWQTGTIKQRSFSISANLYRWVNDGSNT